MKLSYEVTLTEVCGKSEGKIFQDKVQACKHYLMLML
jgi:hypothetical protein